MLQEVNKIVLQVENHKIVRIKELGEIMLQVQKKLLPAKRTSNEMEKQSRNTVCEKIIRMRHSRKDIKIKEM